MKHKLRKALTCFCVRVWELVTGTGLENSSDLHVFILGNIGLVQFFFTCKYILRFQACHTVHLTIHLQNSTPCYTFTQQYTLLYTYKIVHLVIHLHNSTPYYTLTKQYILLYIYTTTPHYTFTQQYTLLYIYKIVHLTIHLQNSTPHYTFTQLHLTTLLHNSTLYYTFTK